MFFLAINRAKPEAKPEAIGAVIPAHIEWVDQRIEDGALLQAGKWGRTAGIWIVDADSERAAMEILAEDPIVRSGLFAVEIGEFHPDAKTVSYE